MDEREEVDLSPEESISDEIGERVRSVLAAAESAATAIRHEAEQQAQIQRRAAEAEGHRLLEDARSEADALLEQRTKRISELSDSIIEGAEAILLRIDGAGEVKRQLEGLVKSLGAVAEQLAAERTSAPPAAAPAPVPRAPAAKAPALKPVEVVEAVPQAEPELEPEPEAEREPEPEPDPEPEPVAEEPRRVSPVDRLREAAGSLRANNGAEEKAEEPAAFEGDEMLAARLVALQMAVAGSARGEVEAHLRKTFEIQDAIPILNDVFGEQSKL